MSYDSKKTEFSFFLNICMNLIFDAALIILFILFWRLILYIAQFLGFDVQIFNIINTFLIPILIATLAFEFFINIFKRNIIDKETRFEIINENNSIEGVRRKE